MCEIKFHCPKCNQKIEAIEDWAGASSSCPTCGAELIIPSKSDEETIVETMQNAGRAYNPLKPTPSNTKQETKPEKKQEIDENDMIVVNVNRFIKSCFVVLLIVLFLWLASGINCYYHAHTCQVEAVIELWEKAFYRELGRFPYMMGFTIAYYFVKNLFNVLLGIYKNTKKA